MRKPQPQKPKTVNIPSQVKIAGGVTLKAMPFKIVAYNDDGSPRLFELQPVDNSHDMSTDGNCVLFAHEEWIRAAQPAKAKAPPKTLNEHETAYIAEIEAAIKDRRMFTVGEISVLEYEVDAIRDGAMALTGPQTLEERLERLRDHYP